MINRTQVRRITIGAQGAAALMAVALVVVIVVGAPTSGAPSGERVAIEPTLAGGVDAAPQASGNVPDQSSVDFEGIAMRLDQMKNAPRPDPVVETPSGGGEDPDQDVAETSGEVKYLGMIAVGLRRSALLNIDGVQRIVPQGATITLPGGGELQLFSVQADYVVLSEGRERRRVEKSSRGGSSVTLVDPSSVAPTPQARPGNSPATIASGQSGRESTPREDFEQRRYDAIQKALAEGRIDEEDAQRMLDRIERLREDRERENNNR